MLSAGRAELAAPLLVALVVATGICERIWPERRPVLARGHVQDACFLALHAVVVIPLMTLLSVGAAALIGGHAGWIELRPAERWPGWLLMPLTVVAMDGANWLAHYADHRLGPLWRFHALHHSQEELSVLTSFRVIDHTTGFVLATVPVVALMPTRPIAPVLITIYVRTGTLQHANLRWTLGPVGRVLVSPAYHRLHHAPDTRRVNLGVVLTIWDVLARLCRFPPPAAMPWGVPAWTAGPSPVEQDQRAHPVTQRRPHPGQLWASGHSGSTSIWARRSVTTPPLRIGTLRVTRSMAWMPLVPSYRRDPAVPQILGHAGLLDVAHAAVDLQADRGQLDAEVGAPRFGYGRQQLGQFSPSLPLRLVMVVPGQVNRRRVGVEQGAHGLDVGLHGQQHAPHISILDDGRRLARAGADDPALPTLLGITQGVLVGALGNGQALDPRRGAAPCSSW